jgi:phage-related protein
MSTIADLAIRLGVVNTASAGLKTFEKDADNAGEHVGRLSKTTDSARESIVGSFKGMVAAAGLTAGAFEAGEFVKGAIEGAENLEKAHESLATAIEHTGGDADKLMGSYENVAKAAAQYGVTETDAMNGLSKATLITGDADKAQRAYEEALVLSKGAHVDFEAALTATSKAQDGITTSLQRYGVQVDKTASSQDQYNAIMERFGGQAAANTTASDQLRANMDNLQAHIGTLLIPAFDSLVKGMNAAVVFMQTHWPEIQATMEKTWAAIEPTLTELEHAIGAVVDEVKRDWPQIETVAKALADNLKTSVNMIVSALRLPIDLIHGDWSKAWNDITTIVMGPIHMVENDLNAAGAIWEATGGRLASAIGNGLANGLKGLVGTVESAASAVADAILAPINAVIGAIDGLSLPTGFDIKTHKVLGVSVPDGVSVEWSHPFNIPKLAIGTNMVNTDGLAYLHAGEAVVPARVAGGGYSGGGVVDGDVVIQVDGAELLRFTRRELNRKGVRNGRLAIGPA